MVNVFKICNKNEKNDNAKEIKNEYTEINYNMKQKRHGDKKIIHIYYIKLCYRKIGFLISNNLL